jgi:hypothetical protein
MEEAYDSPDESLEEESKTDEAPVGSPKRRGIASIDRNLNIHHIILSNCPCNCSCGSARV